MQIQLTILACLFSLSLHASNEKEMKDLFQKYDSIVSAQKTELVDEVFSKKFIHEMGGKEKFVKDLKELPLDKEKKSALKLSEWYESTKKGTYLAKINSSSTPAKSKKNHVHVAIEYVVIKEDGKLKIDARIGDAQ